MHVLSILSSISRTLLLSPLRFILRIVLAVLLPVTTIIRHVSRLLLFSLYLPSILLSRLEAIYIFCGTAAIIGVLIGALLGLISHMFTGALGLQDEHDTDTISCAPSTTSSISTRSVPKKRPFSPVSAKPKLEQQPYSPISRIPFPPSIPTILEEEDEDSPFLIGTQVGRRRGRSDLWVDASEDSSIP